MEPGTLSVWGSKLVDIAATVGVKIVLALLIFIIGLILYLKSKNKTRVAIFVILLSGIAKIGLEFLRESHMGHIITSYQIIVLIIALAGALSLFFVDKKAE